MRRTPAILLFASMLGSCTSTAEAPVVDEHGKRPANQASEIELQRCRHELHNEALLVEESRRRIASNAAALARCIRARASSARTQPAVTAPGHQVFIIHFEFASSGVHISAEGQQTLVKAAHDAPWVVLRGRTDGLVDNLADGRLAKARAEAVRDLLVSQGIDASRIRTTYQATGDAVAAGTNAPSRSLNRRVEVEVYPVAPLPATSLNAAG